MFGIGEGPFKVAEEKMHHKIKHTEGSNIDESFVRKMIAHHEGAIDMSEIVLEKGSDPQVLEMARKSIDEQRKDIDELNRILGNFETT